MTRQRWGKGRHGVSCTCPFLYFCHFHLSTRFLCITIKFKITFCILQSQKEINFTDRFISGCVFCCQQLKMQKYIDEFFLLIVHGVQYQSQLFLEFQSQNLKQTIIKTQISNLVHMMHFWIILPLECPICHTSPSMLNSLHHYIQIIPTRYYFLHLFTFYFTYRNMFFKITYKKN